MRIERKPKNEEIEQSVRDMIDSYGEPNPMISTREWIAATYDFINAVLSGYYDVKYMELDILSGIFHVSQPGYENEVYNQYVRGINAGG